MLKNLPRSSWALLFAAIMTFAPLRAGNGGESPSLLPVRSATNDSIAIDFTVDKSFSSNLAIVVIEEPAETGPGIPARLSVYSGNASGNSLGDEPQVVDVVMRRWSSQSVLGKSSHDLELAAADAAAVSLSGLPADRRWSLRGSTRDKSMLRNGLAYELGRSLFPDATPEFRYCELLYREGDRYRYEGIHILAQSHDSLLASLPDREKDTALIRLTPDQERRGEFAVRAGNKFFTALQQPPDDAAKQAARKKSAEALARLEEALRSVEPASFLRYENLIDQNSITDLYILNMLLLNTDDTPVSLFIYMTADGKLRFLPAWDFDESIDNKPHRDYPLTFEMDVRRIEPPSVLSRRVPVWRTLQGGGDIRDLRLYPMYRAMDGQSFPWFDRLFLSRSFITGLYRRYHQVRREALSPESIHRGLEDIAFRIGPALERDWIRWNREYTAVDGPYALRDYVDEENEVHIRQTWSYDQELVKISRNLLRQDEFLRDELEQLDWMTADLYDRGTSGNKQAAYAFACLGAMMFLMYLLGKRI